MKLTNKREALSPERRSHIQKLLVRTDGKNRQTVTVLLDRAITRERLRVGADFRNAAAGVWWPLRDHRGRHFDLVDVSIDSFVREKTTWMIAAPMDSL